MRSIGHGRRALDRQDMIEWAIVALAFVGYLVLLYVGGRVTYWLIDAVGVWLGWWL